MFFLVRYKRSTRELEGLDTFDENRVAFAALARAERELPGDDIELVLLSSESEETLRTTHARYFESAEKILTSL